MPDDHETNTDPTPNTPQASDGAKSPRDITWRDVHLWQIQPVRDVLLVALVFFVLYMGYVLSVVTVPLLLALTLAYLFEPVVTWMSNRWARITRPIAAGILIGAAVVVVLIASLVATLAAAQAVGAARSVVANAGQVEQALEQVAAEPERRDEIRDALPGGFWPEIYDRLEAAREAAGESGTEPAEVVVNWLRSNAETIATRAARTGAGVVEALIGAVMGVFLFFMGAFFTAFFFFFISVGYPKVIDFLKSLVPDEHNERVVDLASQFDSVVAGFVRGRLTIAFLQGIFFSVGYWIIGVPAAFIIGPVVAVLSIVPYLAMIGIPISVVLMLLDPGGFFAFQSHWLWALAAPAGIYFLGQALDDYVLTPAIQGKATNLDTPAILFATIAGGTLAGVYGMLLAIPVAACLKIALRELFWPKFQSWAKGERADFLPLSKE